MVDKMTKRDYFVMLKGIVPEDGDFSAELVEFIDKQIEQLDAKAQKARERAAIHKAEGDELRDIVAAAVTEEFQTIDQIISTMGLDDPDITRAKVTARLSQLVKAHEVEKMAMTVEGRRVMHYKLA